MQQVFSSIDWFLNASPDYQAKEPTRRDDLMALIERELERCPSDAIKAQLESRKAQLELLYSR